MTTLLAKYYVFQNNYYQKNVSLKRFFFYMLNKIFYIIEKS